MHVAGLEKGEKMGESNLKSFHDISKNVIADLTRNKKIFTVEEILKMPKNHIGFLVDRLIPRASICMIVGRSGVNKSTFCRQLCIAVSSGLDKFLGYSLNSINKRVLYVSSEDGLPVLCEYIQAQTKGLGIPNQSSNLLLANLHDFSTLEELFSHIENHCIKSPLDLIVLDSLSDIAGLADVDINDNYGIRILTSRLRQLSARTRATLVLNHHSSEKSIDVTNFLGASALRQVARSVISIFSENQSNDELHNIRYVSQQKCNYGKCEETFECVLSSEYNLVPTGKKVDIEYLKKLIQPIADIPGKKREKLHDLTVEDVFHDQDLELKKDIIRQRINSSYPKVSSRTIDAWVNKNLIRVASKIGYYSRPAGS